MHQVLKDDAQLFDRSTTWPMHHKRAAVVQRSAHRRRRTSPEMVKAIFMASKMPGLTLAEFFVHWEHVHGPLAAQVPGLRHYDQYHAVPASYAAGMNTHDGWSELWFDDVSSLRAAVASPEWQALRGRRRDAVRAAHGRGRRARAHPEGRVVDVPGLGRRRHERGRGARQAARARLRALADDPGAPAAIKQAAANKALAGGPTSTSSRSTRRRSTRGRSASGRSEPRAGQSLRL